MFKKPIINAASASFYIVLIVLCINKITSIKTIQETVLIPMAMLSLFVLSAAVMGYIFLSEPFKLYYDGKREEAVSYFLKTVTFFACFTAIFFSFMLYH